MPLLAFALVLAAGFGAAALLLRDRAQVAWAELVACVILLGLLVTTLAWFIAAMALTGNAARVVAAVGTLALGAAGLWGWRSRRPRLIGARPVLLVLLPATLLVTWLTATTAFGWDGAFVWQIKANAIAAEDGLPWRYFHDDSRAWSHPIYPLLVPLSRSWLWWAGGAPHQAASKAAAALLFAAALGLLLGPAQRLGRATAALAIALLACTPGPLLGQGGTLTGLADFPLAVYYLGAVLYLLPTGSDGVPRDWPLAACLAAALPWIKAEGKILWASWLVAAIVSLGLRRWRDWARAALPGLAVIIGWTSFARIVAIESAHVFLRPTLALLREQLYLTREIVGACARIALERAHWGLLWVLFAGSILLWPCWGWSPHRRHHVLALAVALPLPFYCLSYFFSTWRPVTLHVNSSFGRLLLHESLLAVLLVAAASTSALGRLAGMRGNQRDDTAPDTGAA